MILNFSRTFAQPSFEALVNNIIVQPFPGDGGYPGLDGRSQSHLAPDLGGGGAEGGAAAGSRASTGSIVVSLLLTSLVIALAAWVGYAYFNPNSSSGRFLIKVAPLTITIITCIKAESRQFMI